MAYFHCLIGGGSSGGGYELTVTCDADFAGTTITATDGVTTLTKTCPSASPYEVEFEIPNGGDWTISGVVSGQTITTGVNIPTTAELIAYVQKTITIYSAKEDTVTYTDVYGDTQTEVFASGQTSKSITLDIMPSGSSITFTSGVAKNPTSLSSAYSKTVTITSNTTDVYLMPDNTLYWWGYESNNLEDISIANGWAQYQSSVPNYTAPTHNTRDIVISGGASNSLSGIGAKTGVSMTEFKVIIQNVNVYNSLSARLNAVTSKSAFNSSIESSGYNVNSADMALFTRTSSNAFPVVYSDNVRSAKVYAFWYE